jgi:voltage-gated potassium channel
MSTTVSNRARLERWERRVEWPLVGASLVFLVAYAWPILSPELPASVDGALGVAAWASWTVFLVDYLVRLALATDRGRFLVHNIFELLVVVLPLLRPLRLLRLLTLLHVLNRHAGRSLRGRVVIYASGAAGMVMFLASLAILDAERGRPGANIESIGDALWWSATTVTTVGYGDRFPVTAQGRAIAAVLMLSGIALLGVVTATLASWLVQRVQEVEEAAQAATRHDFEALTHELARLRTDLERWQSGASQPAGPPHAGNGEAGPPAAWSPSIRQP